MNREDVVRKVAGLLAKAESTDSSAEASALRTKAYELLVRNSIDRTTVQGYIAKRIGCPHIKSAEQMVERQVNLVAPHVSRKVELLAIVASATGCRTLVVEPEGRAVVVVSLIGFEDDVEKTLVLHRLLELQSEREASAVARRRHCVRPRAFMSSFLAGFNREVGRRLKAVRHAAETMPRQDDDSGLVLRTRRQRVDEEFRRRYPYTTPAASSRPTVRAGWQAGLSAGARADLGSARLTETKALPL
jgi:Protein of unknown function (DUF2786)